MTDTTLGDFQPGDSVRIKNNILLDGGKHQGQQGTVHHLGTFYVYVTVPTSAAALPLRYDEIEHAVTPITRDDIDARLADLDTEIALEKATIQGIADGLDNRRRDLNRKTTLAAQYRAVLADLEAQK